MFPTSYALMLDLCTPARTHIPDCLNGDTSYNNVCWSTGN